MQTTPTAPITPVIQATIPKPTLSACISPSIPPSNTPTISPTYIPIILLSASPSIQTLNPHNNTTITSTSAHQIFQLIHLHKLHLYPRYNQHLLLLQTLKIQPYHHSIVQITQVHHQLLHHNNQPKFSLIIQIL